MCSLPYPCGSIFSHIDLLLLTRTTAHAHGLIGQWNSSIVDSMHARYIECLATAVQLPPYTVAVCGRYARTLIAPRIARHGWSSEGKTSEIYHMLFLVWRLAENPGEKAVTKAVLVMPLRLPLALQPRHFSYPWLQCFAYTIHE